VVTRQLALLWRIKQRGVRVVQRLDGINWIHTVRPISLKHPCAPNTGKLVAGADPPPFWLIGLCIKSTFSQNWWNERFGYA